MHIHQLRPTKNQSTKLDATQFLQSRKREAWLESVAAEIHALAREGRHSLESEREKKKIMAVITAAVAEIETELADERRQHERSKCELRNMRAANKEQRRLQTLDQVNDARDKALADLQEIRKKLAKSQSILASERYAEITDQ